MEIDFAKMNGSGNDFIIIDHRSNLLNDVSLPVFVRLVCRRRESVGADGLILIEPSEIADFKWRFFNADGSEAEMCGNGGRCVARYAHLKGIAGPKLSFETVAGIIHAEVRSQTGVLLQLAPPTDVRINFNIAVESKDLPVSSVNTGVPHVVVPVSDIEDVPVQELGNTIRFHPEFQPAGTNVNFVQNINSAHLSIRTYERGVENETLACGTGAVASALVAAARDEVESPVEVKTRGGEILTIHFHREEGQSFSQVFLEGDTCLVFEGILGKDVWGKYQHAIQEPDLH